MTTMATKPAAPAATPIIARAPDLAGWLAKKSHFLFGPRQTGKTFLVRRALPRARVYDLLDSSVYLALRQRPGRSEERRVGKECRL